MEGLMYCAEFMFRIPKESETNVLSLKRQIADGLVTKKTIMFHPQGILRIDLERLIYHINGNTKETGVTAEKESYFLTIRANNIVFCTCVADGQKGVSKDEIYKKLFD